MIASNSGDPDGTVISITGADNLHKVVILNPKGGCGKTTLATNLASYFALHGPPPTLIDCDPQGFCLGWLDKRSAQRPPIYGLRGYREQFDATDALRLEVDPRSSIAIIDLPAAIPYERLHAFTHLADSLLLPIQPSDVDVYSATRFIAALLLDVRLDRSERRLAIVANRVRSTTRSYQMLLRFLASLKIPMIATLKDSQSYVQAAAQGIGISEMPPYRLRDELVQLSVVVGWLSQRRRLTMAQREAMISRAALKYAQSHALKGDEPAADRLQAERGIDSMLEDNFDARRDSHGGDINQQT
jgi:chromosome partitioning protein